MSQYGSSSNLNDTGYSGVGGGGGGEDDDIIIENDNISSIKSGSSTPNNNNSNTRYNSNSNINSNSNRGSRSGSTTTNTTTTTIQHHQNTKDYRLPWKKKIEMEQFWRKIGLLFQVCGVLAVVFTVFLGMMLDSIIDWSWWLVFSPIFVILLIGFSITSSRALATIVSWIIRLTWVVWVIGATVFVFMMIVHLQYAPSVLTPLIIISPIIVISGATMLSGLYSFLFGLCMSDGATEKPGRKQKYIVGGLPMFFAGMTLTPSVVMIALKYANHSKDLSWAICFIPLFTGDAIIACFSFFLLLFSVGARDNSNFSLLQLVSFEFIIMCSLVFKILFTLKLDSDFSFPYIAILIPVIVGELFLVMCGLNLLIKPPKSQDLDIQSESQLDESKPLI